MIKTIIKGLKIGFKLGAVYGLVSALLLILLNLYYVQSIRTLVVVTIYFYLGFGIGFGIIGLILGLILSFTPGKIILSDKQKYLALTTIGIALILFYSALQYKLDLNDFRIALLPISIMTIYGFIIIQCLYAIFLLIFTCFRYHQSDNPDKQIPSWMKWVSYGKFLIVLFVVTAVLINPHRPVSNSSSSKSSETGMSNKTETVPAPVFVSSKTDLSKPNTKELSKKSPTLSQSTVEHKSSVIFIGWDGADWQVIEPLLKQGKMPNLKKLMDRGAYGKLNTYRPTISPAIWTSMCTGKEPREHGIIHFVHLGNSIFFDESLSVVPVSRTVTGVEFFVLEPVRKFIRVAEFGLWMVLPDDRLDRETKAIWNIVSENQKKVDVVNMMMTAPAEQINGYLVSDYLEILEKNSDKYTYPKRLYPEIQSMEINENTLKPQDVSKLFPDIKGAEKLYQSKKPEYVTFWKNLVHSYAADLSSARYADYIYKKYPPDLFILYLRGIDTVSHEFWKYYQPDKFWGVPKEDAQYFGPVIERYYELNDELIKPLVDELDKGATVILTSDHGFEPMSPIVEQMYKLTHTFVSGEHVHHPPGIIIMAGPNIQPNSQIKNMNVMDITPTLLWFLDIPIAKDMEGTLPLDIVTKEYALTHIPKYISTYETENWKSRKTDSTGMSEEYRERLRSLGYIQ